MKNKFAVAKLEVLESIAVCDKFLNDKADLAYTVNMLLMHTDIIEASLSHFHRGLEQKRFTLRVPPQKERQTICDMIQLATVDIETLIEVMKTVTEKYDCGELDNVEKAKSIMTILIDLFLAFAIEYSAITEAVDLIINN